MRSARFDRPAEVARPFLWIGLISFLVGYFGYLWLMAP
jgi:hypothetical protein